MTHKRFNVRVYGLLINNQNEVLLSDEFLYGNAFTKFPGGGLEFGEGTIDCVIREFKEELNIDVEVTKHFYTTDFFVESAFTSATQIISIYYLVSYPDAETISVKQNRYDFSTNTEGEQIFRWKNISDICEEDVTFPIDKKVTTLLRQLKNEI